MGNKALKMETDIRKSRSEGEKEKKTQKQGKDTERRRGSVKIRSSKKVFDTKSSVRTRTMKN